MLVLPGGKQHSSERFRPWQPANQRMFWLAVSLRCRFGTGVRVRSVKYRVRGWNGAQRDPVRDAERALARMLEDVHPHRLVVVGHSMGGRVAAHLSAGGDVGGVVALAPWWPRNDGELVPNSCRLLVLHGTADKRTDPRSSLAQTRRAKDRGVDARWIGVPDAGHYLLTHWRQWHRLTAQFVAEQLSKPAPELNDDPPAPR
ncbi:dienelactone hydrolase family protein [Mycolicibacterium sp. GF69]|uniref:dienelactone hydrolase family protein n=1 Tax=Mycolicibacterium sp. GF69 TaxID=2267251 RepID=UPI001F0C00E7|nr:alpha/beta fold hydrolase [Mycolicibacterium sp. GF69]